MTRVLRTPATMTPTVEVPQAAPSCRASFAGSRSSVLTPSAVVPPWTTVDWNCGFDVDDGVVLAPQPGIYRVVAQALVVASTATLGLAAMSGDPATLVADLVSKDLDFARGILVGSHAEHWVEFSDDLERDEGEPIEVGLGAFHTTGSLTVESALFVDLVLCNH